jgi:pimeloyl-ACP methyl ester carboxylesterase
MVSRKGQQGFLALNPMGYWQISVQFMLNLVKEGPLDSIERQEVSLATDMGEIAMDVYPPHKGDKGSVLFVHGMTLAGKDDERMVRFAGALQSVGFRTFMPAFVGIQNTRIDPEDIQRLKKIIKEIVQDKSLCPHGRLAVIAPSFSAAIAFRAAVDAKIVPLVKAFLSIGGIAHMENVVSFILSQPHADHYATLVILKNYGKDVTGDNPRLQKAFEVAVADDWHKKGGEELEAYLATLPQKEQEEFNKLVYDPAYRKEKIDIITANEQETIEKVNYVPLLENIDFPVYLLHGDQDAVVPPEESKLVHRQLRHLKKTSVLVLSPFISHGDTSFKINRVPDMWRIISGFASFFKWVAR